ncbi:MAG TPA: pyridoxamine 5'-phosphate oxidase family protein [Terriglobales bacterium]|nr:pyridoxamine 5'-phosphate oxidase family protein [Terriglobales bacterium]
MMLDKMTEQECRAALARASIGRLGCSLDDQPYVVPVYLAYDSGYIYVLSTYGQKIEWMRANPKVCVEIDEIVGESRWLSMVVNGRYEELPETRYEDAREHARERLAKRYHWWEPAFAERQLQAGDRLIDPIFFRIRIDAVTGFRAVAEPSESATGTLG